MSIQSAEVAVPSCVVWDLLAHPERYGSWMDASVESVRPPGLAVPNQTVCLSSRAAGRRWHVVMHVLAVDEDTHRIQFATRFPFGISIRNVISCTPIDTGSCLVRYG